MKKTLLVVVMALVLVFSFAALAMAENPTVTLTTPSEAVTLPLGTDNSTKTINVAGTVANLPEATNVYKTNTGVECYNSSPDVYTVEVSDYVIDICCGYTHLEYVDIASNSFTKSGIKFPTGVSGTTYLTAYLCKRVSTYAYTNAGGKGAQIGNSAYTRESIYDYETVTVQGGLSSAYVGSSASSTYYETLAVSKLAASAEIDADKVPAANGYYYLYITPTTGWTVVGVYKNGSDVITAASTNTYKFDMTGRTASLTVKTKKTVGGDTADYVFTVKQASDVKLTGLNLYYASSKYSSLSRYYGATVLYPTFASATYSYYAFIPYPTVKDDYLLYIDAATTTANTVTAKLGSDGVEMKPDTAKTTYSGSTALTLPTGNYNGEAVLTVTANDAAAVSTAKPYTVKLIMANAKAASNTALYDVDVYTCKTKTGSFTDTKNSFDKTAADQTVAVAADQTFGKLTVTLDDKYAYLIYEGEVLTYSSTGVYTLPVKEMKAGKNTFTLTVMAEDCATSKTFTVNVNVGSTGKLSALSATGVNLTPAFAGDKYNYTGYVANAVTSTTISATATTSTDTVYIYGSNGYSAYATGTKSYSFSLQEGLNTFSVCVYNASGKDYQYYYLSIYRIPSTIKAKISHQTATVGYTSKELKCYNINGNNFIQLRDFAQMISGQSKQFNVTYNATANAVAVTTGAAYVYEATPALKDNVTPVVSYQAFTMDGAAISPMAYNIGGNNYIMLRDLCAIFNIGCTYNATTNSIALDASATSSYVPAQ